MSETVYQPNISESLPKSLSSIKYSLTYTNSVIDPNKDRIDPPHIHGSVEIFLNVCGKKSFWVDNKLYELHDGDVIVALPNEIHVCVFEKPVRQKYFCLWINSEDNDALIKNFSGNFTSRLFTFGKDKDEITELFYTLYSSSYSDKNELTRSCALFRILTIIANAGNEKTERIVDLPVTLVDILKYIDDNYQEIESVSEVAKRFFISVPTLNRLFEKYVHITPHKFIESKKLAYAATLLSDGASVTYAGEAAGFSDCSHFILKFKEKFGVTPKKIKQKKQ